MKTVKAFECEEKIPEDGVYLYSEWVENDDEEYTLLHYYEIKAS